MDKKERYYNYVIDDLVKKTKIDHERELIKYPYTHNLTSLSFFTIFSVFNSHYLFPPFIKHCEDVYGLNEQEIDYVWGEYKDIINDKIENNG